MDRIGNVSYSHTHTKKKYKKEMVRWGAMSQVDRIGNVSYTHTQKKKYKKEMVRWGVMS